MTSPRNLEELPRADIVRWLADDEAKRWFVKVSELAQPELAIPKLRRELSVEKAAAIVAQHLLRIRAAAKFSRAEHMLFTRVGLEQASDEAIANYKAKRFAQPRPIADLCCGVGGDLIGLAANRDVLAVDRSDVATSLALHNTAVYQRQAHVKTASVDSGVTADLSAWHLDPDRRATGKRTIRIDDYSPAPTTLLAGSVNAAIKLAPATVVPPQWESVAELEWVETRGECRQQIAWFGDLAERPGRRRAVSLDESGARLSEVCGEVTEFMPLAVEIGQYVHEPHASVRAARLVDTLASQTGLLRVSASAPYLTGDLPEIPSARSYQVVDVLPMREKTVGKYLKAHRIGRVEVKKRGVDCQPAALQKAWKNDGSDSATILICRRQDHRLAAIVSKPVHARRMALQRAHQRR